MPRNMRVLFAAVAAIFTLGLAASTAGATVHPYSTTAGTGTLSTTGIGAGSCNLSRIAGRTSSTTAASITSVSWSGCTGAITNIVSILYPITASINLATTNAGVSVTFPGVTITNILGGRCLYSGSLSGSGTDGTGNAILSGNLTNNSSRSSGFCTSSPGVSLNLTLPGQRF